MTVENIAMAFAFSLCSPGLNIISDPFQQIDKLTRLWVKLIEMYKEFQ